jgi:hypothetical protein
MRVNIKVVKNEYGHTAWFIAEGKAHPFSLEYDTVESADAMIDGLLELDRFNTYAFYPYEQFEESVVNEAEDVMSFTEWKQWMETEGETDD